MNATVEWVIAYIRVSSADQKRGHSIEGQKLTIDEWAEENGVVIDEYLIDVVSAYKKNVKREQYEKLTKLVRNNKVSAIICWKSDRLSRQNGQFDDLVNECAEKGIRIISMTEDIDLTTADGRHAARGRGNNNQYESEKTGERVKMAYKAIANAGNYPLANRPFGYKLKIEGIRSPLIPHQEESKIIKEIYNKLVIDRWGATRILNWLNMEVKEYGYWYEKRLYRLIKNPIYIGTLNIPLKNPHYIRENFCESIISDDVWRIAQKLITSRSKVVKYDYLFNNALICSKCGSRLVNHPTKKPNKIYRYYDCKTCGKRINQERIIPVVFPILKRCISNKNHPIIVDDLNKQLESTYKLMTKYEKHYFKKEITENTFDLKYNQLLQQTKKIERKIDAYCTNELEINLFDKYQLRLYLNEFVESIRINMETKEIEVILVKEILKR